MTSFGKYNLWSSFKAAALAHARLLPLFRLSVSVFSLLSLLRPNHDLSTFLLVSEDNTKKNPTRLKRSAPSTYIPTFQLFPHPLLKTRSTRIDPAAIRGFLEIPETSSACVCVCVAGWWWRTRACCTWSPTRGPSPLSCCWIKSSASRWTPKRRRPNTESGSTASPGESRSRLSLVASKWYEMSLFHMFKTTFQRVAPWYDMDAASLRADLLQSHKLPSYKHPPPPGNRCKASILQLFTCRWRVGTERNSLFTLFAAATVHKTIHVPTSKNLEAP